MGSMSRSKGQRGEREIIDLLQRVVNEVYAEHGEEVVKFSGLLQRNTLQSDLGGVDIVGLPWFAPEVKRCQTLSIARWWEQTTRQAGVRREPVLFYRRNQEQWQVMMVGSVGTVRMRISVPVIVPMSAFMRWFRVRLHEELE